MKYSLVTILLIVNSLVSAQEEAINYGGKSEKKRMFEQELYYSPEALKNFYGGKVELGFKVTSEGKIENIRVLQSVSRDLNKEATRLLKLMLWHPAKRNDTLISSLTKTSFKFNPKKYDKICRQRGYRLEKPSDDFLFTVYNLEELSKKPQFNGKEKNFNDYVKDNLSYPEAAVKTEAQGFVELQFVIEPSGRITNLEVSKSLEANCDIEAKNLILNSAWIPGKKHGIAVRTLMQKKIYFSPSGNLPYISIPDR